MVRQPKKKTEMKHILEVSEAYEEFERAEMEGLDLMKELTQEKLSQGYAAHQSFLWLVKNGSLLWLKCRTLCIS